MTPTIAELLREQGYVTGQFGKNHLGNGDKHLPTLHGFDEFFGNLYYLDAEEEPARSTLMATTSCVTSGVKPRRLRARRSCISARAAS